VHQRKAASSVESADRADSTSTKRGIVMRHGLARVVRLLAMLAAAALWAVANAQPPAELGSRLDALEAQVGAAPRTSAHAAPATRVRLLRRQRHVGRRRGSLCRRRRRELSGGRLHRQAQHPQASLHERRRRRRRRHRLTRGPSLRSPEHSARRAPAAPRNRMARLRAPPPLRRGSRRRCRASAS
jgi:hypothetical protein